MTVTCAEVHFSHDRSKTSKGNGIMNVFVQKIAQSGSSFGFPDLLLVTKQKDKEVPLVTDSAGSCFFNQTHPIFSSTFSAQSFMTSQFSTAPQSHLWHLNARFTESPAACFVFYLFFLILFLFFLSGHNNGKNSNCFAIHLVLSENGSVDLTSILPHGWGLGFFPL